MLLSDFDGGVDESSTSSCWVMWALILADWREGDVSCSNAAFQGKMLSISEIESSNEPISACPVCDTDVAVVDHSLHACIGVGRCLKRDAFNEDIASENRRESKQT